MSRSTSTAHSCSTRFRSRWSTSAKDTHWARSSSRSSDGRASRATDETPTPVSSMSANTRRTQMTEIAERFRRVADGLTQTIDAVPDDAWANPSPCEGWDGRDVIRHLVDWLPGPGFLLGTFGVETRPIASVDDDPAAAWAAVRD